MLNSKIQSEKKLTREQKIKIIKNNTNHISKDPFLGIIPKDKNIIDLFNVEKQNKKKTNKRIKKINNYFDDGTANEFKGEIYLEDLYDDINEDTLGDLGVDIEDIDKCSEESKLILEATLKNAKSINDVSEIPDNFTIIPYENDMQKMTNSIPTYIPFDKILVCTSPFCFIEIDDKDIEYKTKNENNEQSIIMRKLINYIDPIITSLYNYESNEFVSKTNNVIDSIFNISSQTSNEDLYYSDNDNSYYNPITGTSDFWKAEIEKLGCIYFHEEKEVNCNFVMYFYVSSLYFATLIFSTTNDNINEKKLLNFCFTKAIPMSFNSKNDNNDFEDDDNMLLENDLDDIMSE